MMMEKLNSKSRMNEYTLNVAKIEENSSIVGPGNRFVLWLQGCSIKCKGCINQDFIPDKHAQIIKIKELYKKIISVQNIEGITYSGGEPFDQAEGLYYLSLLLKKKGFTIMSYSGYTIEEISKSEDKFKPLLLSCLDILIDGRYIEEKSKFLLWRGSSNQKIHFLTNTYKKYEYLINSEELLLEFSIDENNNFIIKGNFDRKILEQLKEKLKAYGIDMK